ncbi:MAG: ComF family protein [Betaproteobacteria bacterium]
MPPACLLCAGHGAADGLCEGCREALPRLPAARCPICAAPGAAAEVCGRCLNRHPAFDRVVAALAYAFPADALVRSFKYRGGLACARPLAAALTDALDAEPYPDLVIPMPLAPRRLRERGFNQSMEIARLVGAQFGLRISANICSRSRESVPQASLPWKERTANVRNAFVCELNLQGKSIAVVDDVLTTGATLNELAATLKRRGAREVVGWIAARTPQR